MDMQQGLDTLTGWASGMTGYLPQALGAALWIGAGWVTARLARSLIRRVINAGLDRLARRPPVRHALENTGARDTIPQFTGALLFWVVWLFFAAAAAETLGLPVVTASLSRFAYYLPNVLAAILIVFSGLVVGHVVSAVVAAGAERVGVLRAPVLGSVAHVTVVVVSLIVALEQLGINGDVLVIMFAVIVGVLLATGGLAFGLGARVAAGNLIARHYVALAYRPGQVVRIDGVEGTIVDITATSVIVENQAGRASLPAQRFLEVTSLLLPSAPAAADAGGAS